MEYILAIGDVVNDIGADDTDLDFQPAAGVVILITFCSGQLTVAGYVLTDGAAVGSTALSTSQVGSPFNLKLFINNTNFLKVIAGGVGGTFGSFAGIQIQ